ncbi:hypothetical protein [Amycolatopsis anabasis]|uniref:hypothetical protein n=1 Tax=Amycolatopsis anabasis TaxID=1840409 RepID=UPI00131E7A84|nr:hypothetical protein [Amycolatopsis anabasis]
MRGRPRAQRARLLLVVFGLLAVYLAFHALPCGGEHEAPAQAVHTACLPHLPADGGAPHESLHPQCLALPRSIDEPGLLLAALLCLFLCAPVLGLAPARRPRPVPPDRCLRPLRGQDVLTSLCVLRR